MTRLLLQLCSTADIYSYFHDDEQWINYQINIPNKSTLPRTWQKSHFDSLICLAQDTVFASHQSQVHKYCRRIHFILKFETCSHMRIGGLACVVGCGDVTAITLSSATVGQSTIHGQQTGKILKLYSRSNEPWNPVAEQTLLGSPEVSTMTQLSSWVYLESLVIGWTIDSAKTVHQCIIEKYATMTRLLLQICSSAEIIHIPTMTGNE